MDMKITFPDNLKVNAEYKGFTVESDQSERSGGNGSNPAPFDYFLVSLGTCAGIYVLQFMKKRGMALDGVKMIMSTMRDQSRGMLSRIVFKVDMPEDFPEKYKTAIIKAVNLCAVKKHLHDPPEFQTIVSIGDRIVAEEMS